MALLAKDVFRAHLVGCLTENSRGLTFALKRTTHNLSFVSCTPDIYNNGIDEKQRRPFHRRPKLQLRDDHLTK